MEWKKNAEVNRIKLARDFTKSAAADCRSNGENSCVLDKHKARSLELCAYTIPIFGHALNCSEMVLEIAHRSFKGWLEKNTYRDAYMNAVELALARDWQRRIC